MITVYLWKGRYGHASLKIDNPNLGEHYISFHSSDPIKSKSNIGKLEEAKALINGVEAELVTSYEEDKRIIGRHLENESAKSTVQIELLNLDEEMVLARWAQIKEQKRKYNAISNNCSTIVAECLTAGWIGTFTPKPKLTDEVIKEHLRKLHKEVFYVVKIAPRFVELRFKYTHDSAQGRLDRPRIIDNIWAGTIATGMLGMGVAWFFPLVGASILIPAALVSIFANTYAESGWEPRGVENIALHLKHEVG